MNLSLAVLLQLLRLAGFDPDDWKERGAEEAAKHLANWVRDRMVDRIPAVARQLRGNGLQRLATEADVRRALYQLWKRALKVRSGFATDFCRDLFDQAVVPLVLPQMAAAATLEEQLRLVARAQERVIDALQVPAVLEVR